MAHPGFPVSLNTGWTHYANVVAAYVVREDGAGGHEFADLVNNDVFSLSGTNFSIVDDATHGYLIRSLTTGGNLASVSATDFWSSLDAITIIVWQHKNEFADTSPYWVRFGGTFADMPFRVVYFGSTHDDLDAAVGTDTADATADHMAVSGGSSDFSGPTPIGVTWSAASGTVQSHVGTQHGPGTALAGSTVAASGADLQMEDHGWDGYCILVLDTELSDAEWDAIAGEDAFAAFSGGAPTVTGVTVSADGLTISVQCDEEMADGGSAAPANWTINTDKNDGTVSVSAAALNGGDASIIELTPGRKLQAGETLTLDYSQPGDGWQAATGGSDLSSFAGRAVTNNSTVSVELALSNIQQPNANTTVADDAEVTAHIFVASDLPSTPTAADVVLTAQSVSGGALNLNLDGTEAVIGDDVSAVIWWDTSGGEDRFLVIRGKASTET